MSLIYLLSIGLTIALLVISLAYLQSWKKLNRLTHQQRKTIATLRTQTIRNRISSHFFFNALSSLMAEKTEPEELKSHLRTLLLLLRNSVDNIEQLAIPLEEEIHVVKGYISLQRLRIEEPIITTINIDPTLDLSLLVPAMIIQIPLENAIKHGLMPLEGEKILTITVTQIQSAVLITIYDNGIGYLGSSNRISGNGTGLKILYQTIELLNSENTNKIEFKINDGNKNTDLPMGTQIEITIPKHYNYHIGGTIIKD